LEILSPLIMFAIMFGIMYFLLIRPQRKQQQKTQDMLDALGLGDSVVTIGGLHGIVDEIDEEAKTIVLDCEGIYLTFERRAISRVVSKADEVMQPEADTQAEELGTNDPDVDDEDIVEE